MDNLPSFFELLLPKRPLEDCVDEPFSDESFSSTPPIPDNGLRVPSVSRLLWLRAFGLERDSFLLEVEEVEEETSVFLAPLPGEPEAGELAGVSGGGSTICAGRLQSEVVLRALLKLNPEKHISRYRHRAPSFEPP
jgi:hypothetical protein